MSRHQLSAGDGPQGFGPHMRSITRIVWGIFLLFGGFVIYESLRLSYYGIDFGPGPGFFSFWLGILVIGLSVIEIGQTFRASAPLPEDFIPTWDGVKRIFCLLVALVATVFLMNPLGYNLTTLAFCVFLLRALAGLSWWLTLLISFASSFGLFYVFRTLQVLLPTGWFGI